MWSTHEFKWWWTRSKNYVLKPRWTSQVGSFMKVRKLRSHCDMRNYLVIATSVSVCVTRMRNVLYTNNSKKGAEGNREVMVDGAMGVSMMRGLEATKE